MMKIKINKPEEDRIANYIRVGTNYFKIITKPDERYPEIKYTELKTWKAETLKIDFDNKAPERVFKYDDFTLVPDNINYSPVINNCYNLYRPFIHKPKEGAWEWTKRLLKHVFGEQYEQGLIYLKVLFEKPQQVLPVLVLASKERVTGKTTFLDWLNYVFYGNMVQIEPDMLTSAFNGAYAEVNIIGIDETLVDKSVGAEKVKSFATKKFLTVNPKYVQEYRIPCFFKIILATNHETKFMRVDGEEVRFWVRKLSKPKDENPQILNELVREIPAFLHDLKQMPPVDYSRSRMVLTPDEINTEALQKVKDESKSGLQKELIELVKDWFENEENTSEDELLAAPVDIKRAWFYNNSRYSANYISSVLKDEMNMRPGENRRYKSIFNEASKTGTPYVFKREDYCSNGKGNKETSNVKQEIAPF